MTEVAQEVLKLAREAYAEYGNQAASREGYVTDPDWIESVLTGKADERHGVKIAMTATKTTIERAAKIAEQHDTGDCTREDMEARRIAEAIRELLK